MPRSRVIADLSDTGRAESLMKEYRRPYVIPFSRDAHRLTFEIKDRSVSVLLFHDHNSDGAEERLRVFGRGQNFINPFMTENSFS